MLAPALLISAILAQPVPGSWGGYVSGWTPSPSYAPPVRTIDGPLVNRRSVNTQAQQLYVLSQLQAQSAFLSQQNYVERQREKEADALAAQQRLAAQQDALLAQQQAAQAQLFAQQQLLAAQQQQLLAQQQRDAELARARAEEDRAALAKKELELKERELAAREAERVELARAEASKPREKGPDIHRWVDSDGVVHYSTRPPH
jgi:Domain of unknown function (DUF4124)